MTRRIDSILDEDEILARRAARFAVKREARDVDDGLPVAELVLADSRVAVPLADLRGVMALRDVRPVPMGPPHVIGLVRYEGALITAFSLAGLVGVRGWRRDPTVLLIITLDTNRVCAIDSETIPKPGVLQIEAVQRARDHASDTARAEVLRADGSSVTLLDVGALVARTTLAARGGVR